MVFIVTVPMLFMCHRLAASLKGVFQIKLDETLLFTINYYDEVKEDDTGHAEHVKKLRNVQKMRNFRLARQRFQFHCSAQTDSQSCTLYIEITFGSVEMFLLTF
jgi:hypothetical protein